MHIFKKKRAKKLQIGSSSPHLSVCELMQNIKSKEAPTEAGRRDVCVPEMNGITVQRRLHPPAYEDVTAGTSGGGTPPSGYLAQSEDACLQWTVSPFRPCGHCPQASSRISVCSYKEHTRPVSRHSPPHAPSDCLRRRTFVSLQFGHKGEGKKSPLSRNKLRHDVYIPREGRRTFPASYFLSVPVSQGELYDQAASVGFKYTPEQAKGHTPSFLHSGLFSGLHSVRSNRSL